MNSVALWPLKLPVAQSQKIYEKRREGRIDFQAFKRCSNKVLPRNKAFQCISQLNRWHPAWPLWRGTQYTMKLVLHNLVVSRKIISIDVLNYRLHSFALRSKDWRQTNGNWHKQVNLHTCFLQLLLKHHCNRQWQFSLSFEEKEILIVSTIFLLSPSLNV